MTPVAMTGFNRDLVIENSTPGPPYSAAALEFSPGEGNGYYQHGLPNYTAGLPATGLFTSAIGDGTMFQLQPYTTNNALVLSSETGISSGTLTLSAPATYLRIAVIANSANGNSSGAATITFKFSDNSTITGTYFAPDWFNNVTNVALAGMNRIGISTGSESGGGTNPRFYQTTFDLNAMLGAANQPLVSITFSMPSVAKSTGIFAVSGELATSMLTPPVIVSQPASVQVNELSSVNFNVSVTGNPVPSIQWYKNGSAILGATNPVFSIAAASLSDDQAKFQAVAANFFSNHTYTATSTQATLTVVPVMKPIIVKGFNLDVVIENTAGAAPYQSYAQELNPNEGKAFYQNGLAGTSYGMPLNGSFLSLIDGTQFQFQPYTNNNALALSSDTGISSGTLTLTTPAVYGRIALIANSASGGGNGTMSLQFSDGTTLVTNFYAPDWFNNTGYALGGVERISLSTGATDGMAGTSTEDPRFYQTTIDLNALYGVTNKGLVSLSFDQVAGTGATAIYAVSGILAPPSPAVIVSQPSPASVIELSPVSFTSYAGGSPAPAVQWYKNNNPIAGATNSIYNIPSAALADNQSSFYMVAANLIGSTHYSVTSSVVTLTVIADTNSPILLNANSLGLNEVLLAFNKRISIATATNLANFSVSSTNGALAISAANLDNSQSNILLSVSPMVDGTSYLATVNNLQDQTAAGNVIAANSHAQFVASVFTPDAIGNPPSTGGEVRTPGGLTVSGNGSDIGGTNDQFQFGYELITGDFDVSVKLSSLGLFDLWAKAGLMARATLAPSSPFAASLATPGMNGSFLESRLATNGPSTTAGNFPVNYPDTWLRLKRAANVFTAFASYDGLTWTSLGAATIVMSNQIYLGYAVSSHNSAQSTTAQFSNISTVPNTAPTGTIVNPSETLGPCSRKSGIVFSEIMYKPAARTDGNNIEFIELYNSNPWFFDISGYQVTCADMNYTFPPGTVMSAGSFLIIAASPSGIQNVYGITNVMGPYTGSLKKSETLELIDEHGAVLLTVPYSNLNPWPIGADGEGHSIVLAHPTYGEGDPRAWSISDAVGGSPGTQEAFRPSPFRNVVINEILPHSENVNVPQFIKLYNHSAAPCDISGCVLTDDASANKFTCPQGTIIPASGFISFNQSQLGFTMNGGGGTVYFINPDHSRILDAVQFEAQADASSFGRSPDGANDFYRLTTPTPPTNNSSILIGNIVINELMYDPITENDDDQYIELYNQGSNSVNLGGWQFTSGITFTFPTNTIIPANGYLVVSRNVTNLLAKYSNLNSANTIGNYNSKLSHNGERVALAMPQTLNGSNTIYVVEDEVTYGIGGRWGEWSSGGGSSLELLDAHSNHRLAANWADSDDTQKSAWVNIETTGVLDNGANFESSIMHAQVGLLDVGECLVDNVEVDDTNGVNYVSNPDFENGLTNWVPQGCHVRSSLENIGFAGSHSLHVRSSDRIFTGDNSCQVLLNANTLGAGKMATLRFKARWIRGWPEVLLRLNGNWLEAAGALPIPANLGTPGAVNSHAVTNAGPAIYNVTHFPTVPAAAQNVVITANIHDPDGLQNLTLNYRIDPSTNYVAVAMHDDGTGGDAIAGDGIFSATIPGQSANVVAAFYISATDKFGAATRFPSLLPDNSPVRECVVLFGDGNPGGSFGVYHLWLTQTNFARWTALGDLSNEGNDCTFVNGSRVIYNMQGRFAGSPFHQEFNTPNGNLCHYKWVFNDDDKFLGATSFNKIHQPGNSPGDDLTLQREQTSYTFMRALGVPWLSRRDVAVYVNGNRRGALMEDSQAPDGDMVKEYFPNDSGGFLYKMQPWFEFAPTLSGSSLGESAESYCNILPYTTTGGMKKTARYRYMFEMRRTPDSASDYTNVFSLVDAANSSTTPNYVANMENIADMENWMRVFAGNHAAGNLDSFGSEISQNLFGYIGTAGTKYSLMMWDFNIDLGGPESWLPGQNLFNVGTVDTNMAAIYNNPTFRRMYWRALQELINGPLNVANTAPLVNAKYQAFINNGVTAQDPGTTILPWIAQAQVSIAAQLAVENATNFAINPPVVSNDVAYVTGVAPVNVDTVLINGEPWPITWTTVTNWVVAVPLKPGTNQLTVVAVDIHGQPISGTGSTINAIYTGSAASPSGQVVINEIMFDPIVPNSAYVELYNNSSNLAFDLSGWQLPGIGYTFPAGSLIQSNSFLMLVANRQAFAGAYGATIPIFDTFSGTLLPAQNLSLLQPNGGSNLVIAEVQYENIAPWPADTSGTGKSLQLVDPHQDNWRAGNWVSGSPTPGARNTAFAAITPFPPLWINELEASNVTSIVNSAGNHTPWLELYNPGTAVVSLKNLYLASNYNNLTQWAFPSNAVINPGEFKIIFADSAVNLSTTNEPHANFTLSNPSGSLALSRLYNGQPQVLDYVDYTNLPANESYGSVPDGQSFVREQFFDATPGAPNNALGLPAHSFISYLSAGTIYSQNFDSLPDPGSTSVNTANPVTINGTTYSLANPFDFAFPALASGSIGGLGDSALAGWYGMADPTASVGTRFGATDGDQTTGGVLSFGSPNSLNRALGLLATSTTGFTGFGAKIVNQTGGPLDCITVNVTGEVWRQSNVPKTLQFHYYIDAGALNSLTTNATAFLPSLNVSFPTVAGDSGGVAVAGTSPANQKALSVVDQVITNWPAGAALWLVWEMTDSSGKAQGLGIDDLSFSATTVQSIVSKSFAVQVSGTNAVFSWQAPAGPKYQIQYTSDLGSTNWTTLGDPASGTGGNLTVTNAATNPQGFYRLMIVP
jgi:regulation of enolase protein 1 (concanavalin A-like superfamily)